MGDHGGMRAPEGLARRLGPLQERQFRLLWIGQTASAVGDSLIPVAMAFAVLGLGGSATGIGLVLAAVGVFYTFGIHDAVWFLVTSLLWWGVLMFDLAEIGQELSLQL